MLRVRERKGRKEASVEGEGAFTRMAPGEAAVNESLMERVLLVADVI